MRNISSVARPETEANVRSRVAPDRCSIADLPTPNGRPAHLPDWAFVAARKPTLAGYRKFIACA
jgi:hypothetical protein